MKSAKMALKKKWCGVVFFALVGAVFAAFALDYACVDLTEEPPKAILCSGRIAVCERLDDGLLLHLDCDDDLVLSIFGLAEDADVGYSLLSSDGLIVAQGEGLYLPLSEYPGVCAVAVTSRSDDMDWADVTGVDARLAEMCGVAIGRSAAALPRVGADSSMAVNNSSPRSGFPVYSLGCWTEGNWGGDGNPSVFLTELTGFGGNYAYDEHSFSTGVSGYMLLTGGETYTFRVGADDEASLSIGGATSSISGEHAFVWGNYAVFTPQSTGYYPFSVTYFNVGGPYSLGFGGAPSAIYSAAGTIPYAGLSADPAVLVVPWSGDVPSSQLSIVGQNSGVSYGPVVHGGAAGLVSGSSPTWTYTPDARAFLRGGESNAVFQLVQTYEYSTVTNGGAVVRLARQEPALSVDPSVVVVSRSERTAAKEVRASGLYVPSLVYEITDAAPFSVVGDGMSLSLTYDAAVSALDGPTNAVAVSWRAFYDGVCVKVGETNVMVIVDRSLKEEVECDCPCTGGGTTVGAECIYFTQRFGTTPAASSAPWGVLAVREEEPSESLSTPAVLRYNHPMMRRLSGGASGTAVVYPPFGHPLVYQDGKPSQNSVMHDSRLVASSVGGIPAVREVFSDRSEVVYTNGVPAVLVTSDGVRIAVSELGIEVLKDSSGALRQVYSATDGLLSVAAYSGRFRVNWYAPSAVGPKNAAGLYTFSAPPAKYFDFGTPSGGTAGRSFSLVEHRSAELEFHTRWDWSDEAADWSMTRGTGNESVVVSRSTAFNVDGTWTVSTSASSALGVASSSTKTYSGRNGIAVVASTSGGRATYSASRVDSGFGAGRPAASSDSLGLLTTNAYDLAGRVVSSCSSGGPVARAAFYEYPAGGDVPDFTPSRVVHVANGVTNRIDTYERVGTRESGLEEMSTVSDGSSVRTNLTFRHPSVSANIYEAGRVSLTVASDGRAETNSYEAVAGALYVHTATRGLWSGGAFAVVDGKSTRIRRTYDVRGDVVAEATDALVGGEWREIESSAHAYNLIHRREATVRSDGKSSSSSWICTGPLWTLGEDGVSTTNAFNSVKRMSSTTRHGPFGAVTTAYALDAEGRVVAETRTAAGMTPLATSRTYDTEGRITSETDEQGLTTTYAYSADGKVTTVTLPSGGTRVTTLNADGTLASVTGTAVTPEFYSYGVTDDGLEWTKTAYLSPVGARWAKTYRNAFGETVREERPGANGSTLVTERTYDAKGRLVSTVSTGQPTETRAYDAWGDLASVVRSADGTSRTQSQGFVNALLDGEVWRVESGALSCSDATIAPLVMTNMTQLSGLSLSNESRKVSIDVRGNATETWSEFAPSTSTRRTWRMIPEATNVAYEESVDGAATLAVSHSSVTNAVAYDAYRRVVTQTDGRGNTTTNAYDSLGRLAFVTDATGATTSYAYDAAGNIAAVTNALGVATIYEYDVRGNKTYEGGGTYPVSYAYDAFNVMTNMTTYRDCSVPDASASGDTTTWLYDEVTGLLLSKAYADGHGPTYTYTDSGNMATRTWARGVVTTYSYDGWNNLTNTAYSDDTPSISLSYDAMGRQVSATDAAGTTVTTYNDYGEVVSEVTTGLCNKTLSHPHDAFGRDLGYTIDNSRKSIIEYEVDTARMKRVMMAGAWFTYHYLPGTDLKSRLQYGGSGSAYYSYEPHRDILTQVQNHINGGVISQYDYVNDAVGRRIVITRSGSMMSETRTDHYGYNDRSELVSGTKDTAATNLTEYAYQYDDIGNRLLSLDLGTNRTYVANALNQYTNIVEDAGVFLPQFDDDGNQTLVKTSTGIWSVTYNGENRPVLWSCGNTNITMKFDRMGRRVEYIGTVGGATNAHHRFVYDGYLCVQRLDAAANNAVDLAFGWDPSEPVATRPLVLQKYGQYNLFYTHDGNKNVSELVFFQQANGIAAHYEYAPFGAVTATSRNTPVTAYDFCECNPFRFSSEYADSFLELFYYNYRYYNPYRGRWVERDPIGELLSRNLMLMLKNSCVAKIDNLGLCCCGDCQIKDFNATGPLVVGIQFISGSGKKFGTISIEKIIEDFGYDLIDDIIKEHGDSLLTSIYKESKNVLNQKSRWETIGSFLISTGFLFHPQLEIATKISYYRRDCTRKWWQLGMGNCQWSSWQLRTDIHSEWVSPKEETFGDSRFAVSEIITHPKAVFQKIREDLQNIMELLVETYDFNVEDYKTSLGCMSVE